MSNELVWQPAWRVSDLERDAEYWIIGRCIRFVDGNGVYREGRVVSWARTKLPFGGVLRVEVFSVKQEVDICWGALREIANDDLGHERALESFVDVVVLSGRSKR